MSITTNELRELENLISDRIHLQVENWHLYLGDAGLSEALALECQLHLHDGPNVAARKAFEGVQVQLGGGNTKMSLSRLISSGQIFELEEILDPYCR